MSDIKPASEIKLSPFYNSAVNSVTQPNKITWTSDYFLDRWMPLLGGEGTRIVLALRRHGYNNRKTGQKREEIKMDLAELAALVGCSVDTLSRQIDGVNPKTGQPYNPWLSHFVKKYNVKRRNRAGQFRQEENGYWVSMDDPIHPGDWHLVEAYILAHEGIVAKGIEPEPHFAEPVGRPEPHFAEPEPQNAEADPHFAEPKPQNAERNMESLDSYIPEETLNDAREGAPEVLAPPSFPKKKEPDRKEPDAAPKTSDPWPFDLLPEVDRASWLDRAERELRGNFGAAVWAKTKEKGRAAIRERRAANLYLTSLRADAPRRNRAG